MAEVSIDGLTVKPGSKAFGKLEIGYQIDGNPIKVDYVVLNGNNSGKRLFLFGCVHGNEILGIEVIRQVMNEVNVKRLSGTIICVPCCNVLAYMEGQRYFLHGMFPEPRDLNRVFPGKPSGTITERLAYTLYEEIVRKSDYGIDLHNSAFGGIRYPYGAVLTENRKWREEVLRFAKSMEIPIVFAPDNCSRFTGWLASVASDHGIPTVLIEWGVPSVSSDDSVEEVRNYVLNSMSYLGMLNQPKNTAGKSIVIGEEFDIRPTKGGLIHLKVKPGERVKKGQPVAEITDFFNVIETLRAPKEGVVLRVQTHPATTGDRIITIGTKE